MYNQPSATVPDAAVGAAKFDGLALVQNAAVLMAVRHCKDRETRKALNAAIAINHVRAG